MDRRRFAELWLEGVPAPQIAEELGISSANYARVIAQRMGLPKRRKPNPPPVDLIEFRKDYRNEMLIREMSKKYGVTEDSIMKIARRLELPYRCIWRNR